MLTLLLAIVALGVLIIIHEGGHYLAARYSGMRVDKFSIGFGPAIARFQRGETSFQIGAVPLGGYVQIAGLNPQEDGLDPDDPRAFPNRPLRHRLLTIFAGPGTNYLFAALMMTCVYLGYGLPVPGKTPMVMQTVENAPAAAAGLKPGDEIVSVDGKRMADYTEVSGAIEASHGKPITLVVRHDGAERSLTVTPKEDGGHYRVGIEIGPKAEFVRGSFGASLKAGLVYPYDRTMLVFQQFGQIFAGKQKAEFSGPVGIVSALNGQIKRGAAEGLSMVAFISVALGLFNLLPLPAVDGGRLVFLGWEGITRRRVNPRFENAVHLVGLLALFGLLILFSVGDVRRLLH